MFYEVKFAFMRQIELEPVRTQAEEEWLDAEKKPGQRVPIKLQGNMFYLKEKYIILCHKSFHPSIFKAVIHDHGVAGANLATEGQKQIAGPL